MDLGLAGRVAVVTGASRGIGREVTRRLVAEGAHVVACARSSDDLDVLAREAPSPDRVVPVALDVVAPDAGPRLVTIALDRFARLDILVNNVGAAVPRRLTALTAEDWQAGFDVNFFSAVHIASACLEPMRERGWGRIVNVASTSGREPDPYFGPYSAAKAALINFAKNLANAVSADGVLVNSVAPGITRTAMVEQNIASAQAATGQTEDDVIAKMLARQPIPAGRLGRAEEIAAAIVFLVSEQAGWISGACLAVDGGTLRSVG
jgi:NAD(P)-dependent dehydrogenase (short-subunit alcohol dehydrogenase family)